MSFHKKLLIKALKAKNIPVEEVLWDLSHVKTVCRANNIDPDKIINANKKKRS